MTACPGLRRAFGDIGNLVGPFNTRCQVGKESNADGKGQAEGLDAKVTAKQT